MQQGEKYFLAKISSESLDSDSGRVKKIKEEAKFDETLAIHDRIKTKESEFNTLQYKVEEGGLSSLTEEEMTKYSEMSELVAQLNKDLVKFYDKQGRAILKTGIKIDEVLKNSNDKLNDSKQKMIDKAAQFLIKDSSKYGLGRKEQIGGGSWQSTTYNFKTTKEEIDRGRRAIVEAVSTLNDGDVGFLQESEFGQEIVGLMRENIGKATSRGQKTGEAEAAESYGNLIDMVAAEKAITEKIQDSEMPINIAELV
jgi:hypothetical protein